MPQNRSIIFFLAINASITFISDMTMMLSMLMTSPLAVTLGLSLTIPLAVFGDILRGTQIGGITLFIGATLVLGGFVAVGLADAQEKDEEIIEQILGASAEEGPGGNGDEEDHDSEARQPVLPTHVPGRLSPIAGSADTLPPSR
jgi:solute carrier family 35 protein F5